MAPHAAWFFRHLAADNPAESNNFVFKSDDWLFATRWEQLIAMNPQPDYVELQTWNDWGESHYLGPLDADAGEPSNTVDSSTYSNSNFPHTPMLGLNNYYAQWYKSGSAPAIQTDTIYWWTRTQPVGATASSDPIGAPTNLAWLEDNIYAVVLLSSSTTATSFQFTVAGAATDPQPVSPGLNKLKVAFTPGNTSVALLDSSGTSILSQPGPTITDSFAEYNDNYWSGSIAAS